MHLFIKTVSVLRPFFVGVFGMVFLAELYCIVKSFIVVAIAFGGFLSNKTLLLIGLSNMVVNCLITYKY